MLTITIPPIPSSNSKPGNGSFTAACSFNSANALAVYLVARWILILRQ